MKITFLGGVWTVTGSKTLLDVDNKKILFDRGPFQGQYIGIVIYPTKGER